MSSGLFKIVIYKLSVYKSYIQYIYIYIYIYIYKEDLALNDLQELICHKNQPTNGIELKLDDCFLKVQHAMGLPVS